MKGHIRQRGRNSFELKFETAPRDPATGRRFTRTVSFRGSKRAAMQRLAELLKWGRGATSSRPRRWSASSCAAVSINGRRAALSARVLRNATGDCSRIKIGPHIGAAPLQKLTRLGIEAWHTTLKNGGLAPRTVGHAHRVLSQALSDAERDGAVVCNVAKLQKAPKVPDTKMIIVRDVTGLIAKLQNERLFVPAIVALTTGARLGEILAMRERRLDLDTKVVEIAEALEETKAHQEQGRAP